MYDPGYEKTKLIKAKLEAKIKKAAHPPDLYPRPPLLRNHRKNIYLLTHPLTKKIPLIREPSSFRKSTFQILCPTFISSPTPQKKHPEMSPTFQKTTKPFCRG